MIDDPWAQILLPALVNLSTSSIIGLLLWAARFGRARRLRVVRNSPWILQAAIVLVWLVAACFAARYAVATGNWPGGVLLVAVPSGIAFGFQWYENSRYWAAGIGGARSVATAELDPKRTLSLVRDSLDFLGTGAGKLTSEEEFRRAVLRCSAQGSTVRLLLSEPNASNLQTAAQRANKPIETYQEVVKQSLRVIADLHHNQGVDVQVRFYTGARRFRLMFVDDRECLVSYNVYASREPALSYPAVRLIRSSEEAVRSFYWAFQQYFNDEWEAARTWDYKEMPL